MTFKTLADVGLRLTPQTNFTDVLGVLYGENLDSLIITEADLSPEFFNLSSGLLGELFQKLANYQVLSAVVIPDPAAHGERFAELAREHARHPQIRFFTTEEGAREWLGKTVKG